MWDHSWCYEIRAKSIRIHSLLTPHNSLNYDNIHSYSNIYINMATNYLASKITGINSNIQMDIGVNRPESTPIKWEVYNFPPCLRLIHFNLTELNGLVKKVVLLLYIQLLTVFAIVMSNCMIVMRSLVIYYTRSGKSHWSQNRCLSLSQA